MTTVMIPGHAQSGRVARLYKAIVVVFAFALLLELYPAYLYIRYLVS